MASFNAPVNPPSGPSEAALNLTSPTSTSEATGSAAAAPSATKPPGSSSSDPQSARLLALATAAVDLAAIASSRPSSSSGPAAVEQSPAPPPQHVSLPLHPPPSRPSQHQAPPTSFTAIDTPDSTLHDLAPAPPQPTAQAPSSAFTPINTSSSSLGLPLAAAAIPTLPPNLPPPSQQQIILAPYVPTRSPRHDWTDPELDILCCLRNHTALSYEDISILIQNLVGGPRLAFEVLRYKCTVMRALLPPSERARRTRAVTEDPRWTHFAALTPRAMPVQSILRACGHQRLWFGQAEEDAMAVLLMYSDLVHAEIAQRLTQKFDGECSEKMVRWWHKQNVRTDMGSWAWFEGKGKEDAEVKRVLGEFGL